MPPPTRGLSGAVLVLLVLLGPETHAADSGAKSKPPFAAHPSRVIVQFVDSTAARAFAGAGTQPSGSLRVLRPDSSALPV